MRSSVLIATGFIILTAALTREAAAQTSERPGTTDAGVHVGAYSYLNAPMEATRRPSLGFTIHTIVVPHIAAEAGVARAWTQDAFVCPLSSSGGCGGGLANARTMVSALALAQTPVSAARLFAGGGVAWVHQDYLKANGVRTAQPMLVLGGMLHLFGRVSARAGYNHYFASPYGSDHEFTCGADWRVR